MGSGSNFICTSFSLIRKQYVFFLCLYVLFYATLIVRSIKASSLSTHSPHFNGLHLISGKAYLAFRNRIRRHLKGKKCLIYHTASNWWMYHFCVDEFVKQLHTLENSQGKSHGTDDGMQEFVMLGHYTQASKKLRVVPVENFGKLQNPDVQGYMALQIYDNGTICSTLEHNTLARQTTVQYKCCIFREQETYIESIYEPNVCNYIMTVCTPAACGLMLRDQHVIHSPMQMSEEERSLLVSTVKEMFYHGYYGYLKHAFPQDVLAPITCTGKTFELGNIPILTLIDTIDTLAVLEDVEGFQHAAKLVKEYANFDLDAEVSVFETTIRVLGGLLSAHAFAIDEGRGLYPTSLNADSPSYSNEFLILAVDLADRIMPAFNTPTGIPYGTINLKLGVPKGETPIASTAGAGSLSMEFTMLSVFTGNQSYADAGRRSVRAIFDRRSSLGLIGKHIHIHTGEWTESNSGIGSNSDSFYEYLLKMYYTFGDTEALEMFEVLHKSVNKYILHGDWYGDVSMWTGCSHRSTVYFENLSAFWPGLEISLGNLKRGSSSVNAFYRIWRDHGFIPEQFNLGKWEPIGSGSYPLRPELIESTFYLHEATNHSSWLRAGAHVVHSIQKYCKTECGYASIANVDKKTQENVMPSFFLSETCKYLYLLFNTSSFIRNGRYVMTTEAHPFPILSYKITNQMLWHNSQQNTVLSNKWSKRVCPLLPFWTLVNYRLDYVSSFEERTAACRSASSPQPSSKSPTTKLIDTTSHEQISPLDKGTLDYLTQMFNTLANSLKSKEDDSEKWLPILKQNIQNFFAGSQITHTMTTYVNSVKQFLLNPLYNLEELSNLQWISGGNELGAFSISSQYDGSLLRVTQVKSGEWIESWVLFSDTKHIISYFRPPTNQFVPNMIEYPVTAPVHLLYEFPYVGPSNNPIARRCWLTLIIEDRRHNSPSVEKQGISCASAIFGAVYESLLAFQTWKHLPIIVAQPIDACSDFTKEMATRIRGKIVIVDRGICLFENKAQNVENAGGLGLLVVNTDELELVLPMQSGGFHKKIKPVQIPMVMVSKQVGEWLKKTLLSIGIDDLFAAHMTIELERYTLDFNNKVEENRYPLAAGNVRDIEIFGLNWGISLKQSTMNGDQMQQVGIAILKPHMKPQT